MITAVHPKQYKRLLMPNVCLFISEAKLLEEGGQQVEHRASEMLLTGNKDV